MTFTIRVRVALAVAMTLGGSAFGQTLADRVPADSVVYFGWRGTANPGSAYAGSRWAAALKESNVGKLIDETLPAAGVAAERKWPQFNSLWRGVATALKGVIKRPSAVFLRHSPNGPQWGVFCQPGKDTAEVTAAFELVAKNAPSNRFPRVIKEDGYVGLVFGFPPGAAVEGGLASDAAFAGSLKHVIAGPSAMLYVNVKHWRELALTTIGGNLPPDTVERINKLMDASGIVGVNAYTWAAGFDGRDWAVDAFLDAPSPRKGFLNVSKETAIDAALLKRIPASANTARVFHLDAAGLLNDTRNITSAAGPEARDMLEKVIGASKLAVGRDLTTDLLPSLGTQWAAYTSSDVGGTGTAGVVLVNRLKNPAKAKQAMVSLSLFLSNSGLNLVPDKRITLGGRMTKVGDLQVYYAATPLVSPAWTIKDDCLYLGLYPQPVIEAARYAGASIESVPAFAELLKPKGEANAVPLAIAYTDVSRTIDDGYTAALAGSRLLFGLGDMFLAPSPEPVLPTLPALRAQVAPATTAVWADDSGFHVRARSPFPGAETMATFQVINPSAVPVAASVLLPALNRAREQANRVASMSHLRQIGLAAAMSANEDRQNRLPADFAEILRKQEITADVFLNPRKASKLPPVPPGTPPTDAHAAWVNDGSDYVYVGKGKRLGDGPDGILAYEKPEGLEDGISVLFLDFHAEFVPFDQLDAVFAKAGVEPPQR